MRIYVALDITRTEGPNLDAESVREAFEAELADTLEADESYYDVAVAGSGATVKDMQESIKLRKANRT